MQFYFPILHVKHTLLNNMYWVHLSSNHLAVVGFKCRRDLCRDIYDHFKLLCFQTVTLHSNVLFLYIFIILLPFVWCNKVFITLSTVNNHSLKIRQPLDLNVKCLKVGISIAHEHAATLLVKLQ